MTEKISKSKLKARMLQIFRRIDESGEEIIVTDYGRPVLRIVPNEKKLAVDEMFEDYQGRVEYFEDPDTPTSEEWLEL